MWVWDLISGMLIGSLSFWESCRKHRYRVRFRQYRRGLVDAAAHMELMMQEEDEG
ncbi:hypothetical protein CsSME_00033919 [Camellia sinensis var. sinensis]